MNVWIIIISVLVAKGRFFVPGHDLSWAGTYEALAHIWVGVLLCLICDRRRENWARVDAAISLALITALEAAMFLCR